MGKRKFQNWASCLGTLRHLKESMILLYWAWDDSGMLRWPLVVFRVSYSPLWAMLGEPQKAPLTIRWETTLNVFESPTTLKRPNIKIYLMSSGEATTPLWKCQGSTGPYWFPTHRPRQRWQLLQHLRPQKLSSSKAAHSQLPSSATKRIGWGEIRQWFAALCKAVRTTSPPHTSQLDWMGFLVERVRWPSSTRSGRILASIRSRQLTWEEPLLKEVNFCLSALMTQSRKLKTDFAEARNRSDSKNLY